MKISLQTKSWTVVRNLTEFAPVWPSCPPGVISSGQDSESEEVSRFISNAPRAHEYLTGLADSMGFAGNGSFTLRSAATVRTFFIENGICLAVLHGRATFAPGVRDRLILTARLLADIVD